MQFPNPSSLPVISEEKSCRRIKFPCKTTKRTRNECGRGKKRGEKKKHEKREEKRNERYSNISVITTGARDTVMVKEWSKWSLLNFNTLFDHLQHSSSSFDFSLPLSLPRSLYTLAPVFSIPGALSLPGASSSVPFLPVPFPLSVGEPMPSQSAGKVESRRRWRRIRETRGASAGVAMTQSQRGPMDLAGVREVFGGPRLGVARAEGCVARGAHHLRHSLRGGMPKCAPGCNIIPLGG